MSPTESFLSLSTGTSQPSVQKPPVELLLADELTLVRQGLAALCNAIRGYRVVSQVDRASAALEEIERLQPALALLDADLSDLAATEVIRIARKRGFRTRCAVLGARQDRNTILAVFRSGACGFISKSSSCTHMADALAALSQGALYLSPQIAIMSLFGDQIRSSHDDPVESLSSREFQVFSLLVAGLRAKEIAARLSLSPKTVASYRASLMRKLDIHDLAGLVKYAVKRDIAR